MSLKKVNEVKKDRGFKLLDLIIYISLALTAAALFIAIALTGEKTPLEGVIFQLSGETVYEYSFKDGELHRDKGSVFVLDDNEEFILLEVKSGNGYNRVKIDKAGEVRVTGADCGKGDCMYSAPIKDGGGMIYCSPHRLKIIPFGFDPDDGKLTI